MNGFDMQQRRVVKDTPQVYYRSYCWKREEVGVILREEWFTTYINERNAIGYDLLAFRESLCK